MSELSVTKITDRVGTGKVNFSQGFKVAGTLDTTLAPTRTEGNTEPETPVNGDTWYDTDNDTYDVYINGEWKRFLGAAAGPVSWTVDVSNITYDSVSFSLSLTDTRDVSFSNDGTKMFIIAGDRYVYQYSLSTAFDVSTASYDSISLDTMTSDYDPEGMSFNNDGTKMYIAGDGYNEIDQYSLSTAFDLSTASYDSVAFSTSSQDTLPRDIAFSADGSSMYILADGHMYQYSLSTAFDISTASYASKSLTVSTQDTQSQDLGFNTDGTKMYLTGFNSDRIHQYSLSTAFDLSTASYDNSSFDLSSQISAPVGMHFSSDGQKVYVLSYSDHTVYQYSTGL